MPATIATTRLPNQVARRATACTVQAARIGSAIVKAEKA